MMSMQEMSDRLEIQDLLTRYSYAVDEHDWDAFDEIFTPDAIIDYAETGGARGTVPRSRPIWPTSCPSSAAPNT